MSEPVRVQLQDIVQEYDKPDGSGVVRVVDGISLDLTGPSINMVLGPSGCGKSTVLKMMGGVRPMGVRTPTSGQVLIDGAPCEGPHPDAIMVFQRYANRPDLSVQDNVGFPFRFGIWRTKVDAAEQKQRVADALEAVGLADKAHHRPSQLSGGQNQRVAIARALVTRPRILLMDEPFGALDAQIRSEMQTLLIKLWEQQRCLVVFITHDVTEAVTLGDRVIVFGTQPARIVDDFPIAAARPRDDAWLRSPLGESLQARVLHHLRAAGGHGQVRVSV